jgi:hypothetical protein
MKSSLATSGQTKARPLMPGSTRRRSHTALASAGVHHDKQQEMTNDLPAAKCVITECARVRFSSKI